MAVLVDLEKRTIRASIRDLTQSLRPGTSSFGLLGRLRSDLGTRVHQQYRKEQPKGFVSEAQVQLSIEVAGFQAQIRGRIDGLMMRPEEHLIEEVKSVTLGRPDLQRITAESFPDYCLQLRLYALAYAEAHPGLRVTARLVLISLLDDFRRDLEVPMQTAATRLQLIDLLQAAIEQAKDEKAQAQRLAALAQKLVFPYAEPRPHQHDLMEVMTQGLDAKRPVLAMAPTGIGKTVSALWAGLHHALSHHAPLLYLTSKTTQQQLVARSFEDICKSSRLIRGELRCLTLRNKESMCPPKTLACHPELCPYLEDFHKRLASSTVVSQLLDCGPTITPEAVLAAGEAHRLCPFALSLEMIAQVQLVVCDYNYAFDPGVALEEFYGENARPPLVIIDEAHNLFDRARGYFSPFLSSAAVMDLDQRIGSGEIIGRDEEDPQIQLSGILGSVDGKELASRLRTFMHDVLQAIHDIQEKVEEEERPMLEDCRQADPDLGVWQELSQQSMELMISYLVYSRTHALIQPQDPVLDLLTTVIRIREVLDLQDPAFVPYSAGRHAPNGDGFGCLCVNPSGPLNARHRLALGTLALSATLTPLSYFSDVLGFAPLNPITASIPSPFAREHLGVFVLPAVSTSFSQRDRYRQEIARIIEQTYQSKPGRYAAYFPSFKYLGDVRSCLQLPSEQILTQIPGLSEPARRKLLDQFRLSEGQKLLLAVMGGVFAEGIDLPGSELIGAIVVGLGLPQVGFERTIMQEYFERQYERGFAYAMLYPGMQRVIQSAGRVIRTPDDVGVIVLADRRFADPEVSGCFPEHWYSYDASELITEDLPQRLAAFWKAVDKER